MNEDRPMQRDRDIVLSPAEYAYVLDKTKGHINALVGPYKASLSATDAVVRWNPKTRKFDQVTDDLRNVGQEFIDAPEGYYVVLTNPAAEKQIEHPEAGKANNVVPLNIGCKVNIPGPIHFALWPGQTAEVVEGHHLRSNQFALARVYNESQARDNWSKAVIATDDSHTEVVQQSTLKMGQLIIIKGTDVSFFIPPTGIEVIPDEDGEYVRDAVTLERLEYAILLDENGNKRFAIGPDVVFPEATEVFVTKDGCRKFRAIELNENSGIYIKVIADYEEGGKKYSAGDIETSELFITGKEQAIYFPRQEHAIVKYGDGEEIYYAVVIPEGEARYVLDKETGIIRLEKGPKMFLPDPRKEVIVKRILSEDEVRLWFPQNDTALKINLDMAAAAAEEGTDYLSTNSVSYRDLTRGIAPAAMTMSYAASSGSSMVEAAAFDAPENRRKAVKQKFAGDEITRKKAFTPPRTLTLDTKYEGAVNIDVYPGYAVLVVDKKGNRRVVVGPAPVTLEYSERLVPMELSTGKPKTTDRLLKTVYLRVANNKVSDIIEAETADMCPVSIKVSYRLNFTGAPEKWFDVENYVKFLCDHLRSKIRNMTKSHGIEDFYGKAIDYVRDCVLGANVDGKGRTGANFVENGMHVYDVEVLDVQIKDANIGTLITGSQRVLVKNILELQQKEQELAHEKRKQDIARQQADERNKTQLAEIELKAAIEKASREKRQELADLDKTILALSLELEKAQQAVKDAAAASELERSKAQTAAELARIQALNAEELAKIKAEAEAVIDKAKAVSPELATALSTFADKDLAGKMAEAMAPMAILGGKSVTEILATLLAGTGLDKYLKK